VVASGNGFSMPAVIAQDEFELKDARIESPSCGVFAELRDFYKASKALGGLLTQTQAARILEIHSGSISSLVLRGRLSSVVVGGIRMVSAAEILALHKERSAADRSLGGRGLKAPVLSDMIEGAWEDILKE
jgi:hypothetical protein